VALAAHEEYMQSYHQVLCREIQRYLDLHSGKLALKTLYLGGGTPSTYPLNLLLDTFAILKESVTFEADYECTLEVNPGTVTEDHFKVWQQIGVNRISLGVQSLNEVVLKKLNRHQSTFDVEWVIQRAHNFFKSVSIDLIVGLPGVSVQQWQDALKKIVQWPISHLSIYFLTVHEQTPLYFGVQKKTVLLPCDDEVVDQYYWSIDFLKQHEFEQYEVSSFARHKAQSKHNSAYWNREPFKGFGLGAWSFDGSGRYQNEKNLMSYFSLIEENKDASFFQEQLTPDQVWLEKLMLGLRQHKGVLFSELTEGLSDEKKEKLNERIQALGEQGFIAFDGVRLQLMPKALSVENYLIEKLSF
jgi:oxygen-independent coproporphyrinogen-3 oxidase